MIEHLLDHGLGLLHVLMALASLCFGSLVIFWRKGDKTHRWLGRSYLAAMSGLNLTALSNFELFGRFGPFHWLALISLASIMAGFLAVRRKGPHWKHAHAWFMTGSYVGLLAATAAEIASRVPGWSFGAAVAISSGLVIFLGLVSMSRILPGRIRS